MTFHDITCTCAVCGAESTHQELMSCSSFRSPDLDFRPAEMARSAMPFWIRVCPECGLVAPSLEEERGITKEWLAGEDYQTCRGVQFKSSLAADFFHWYMICEAEGIAVEAFHALMHAAWACDDVKDYENAEFCRYLTLPISQWLIRNCDPQDETEGAILSEALLIRADVLRRIKEFGQLLAEYEDVHFGGEHAELFELAIAFHREKAEEQDAGCYTFDDIGRPEAE